MALRSAASTVFRSSMATVVGPTQSSSSTGPSQEGHFTDRSHVMLINGYARDAEGQEWFFVANPGREIQRRGGLAYPTFLVCDGDYFHNERLE